MVLPQVPSSKTQVIWVESQETWHLKKNWFIHFELSLKLLGCSFIICKRGNWPPWRFFQLTLATLTTSFPEVFPSLQRLLVYHQANTLVSWSSKKFSTYLQREWKLLSPVWLFAAPWTIQFMEFSRLEYWSGELFLSPGDLPSPGIEPRSPALQADSSPAEPQGKSKNTGLGSLSLLFSIQESNRGLLHCRRILYQLSYQGRTMTVFSEIVSFLRPGAKSSTYMPFQP